MTNEEGLEEFDIKPKHYQIGDKVRVSEFSQFYLDWRGVTLEIVEICRARGIGYTTRDVPPPIRYGVKDVKDSWTYGYTDGFKHEELELIDATTPD